MAAHRPTMRRLVEDEVLVRARTFATEGAGALFAGLESRAKRAPPVLELTKHIDMECRAGEGGSCSCRWSSPRAAGSGSTDDSEVPAVSFRARGAGAALREPQAERSESGDRLGLLLGRGRASVLRQLGGPLTTAAGPGEAGPVAVRRRSGCVCGGDRGLYDRLSALDNLRRFAGLYAVEPCDQKRRTAELLDLVGLTGRERERVEGCLPGNAVAAASITCVYGGTMAISDERRYGTLGAVLPSPRIRAPLWFGRALP
ncbi:hypothetical protein ACFVW8_27780 [Streptomyces sp. NPDC058221]|uniref:hypothetical protein n=1 Tax=Streptomyces sp. NPDC058221 TaxID=3346388 RepID=UPI0036EDF412